MGKKKGKTGKGAEKTLNKTEKNAQKKAKKLIKEKGEEDIETLIAEFQAKDRKRLQTIEEKCLPPSRRCNMSLTAHPDKDELIMFGGEYFNGSKTLMYNDLFFYNIKANDWTKVTSPDPPPPRCAHQAVALRQDGGQLWVFGGEFSSMSQSQFHHYKDLWMFSLKHRTWQKVSAPGGPTSRSGHRMVAHKKLLFVFGGFHDNIRDYKYFNDVHVFSMETYTWSRLDVAGRPPAPRSACVMGVTATGRILVYGGYSKERLKKDADKGCTHSDMFLLTPEAKSGGDEAGVGRWKWVGVKQHGARPTPRCGCSIAVTAGHRALVFGGVYDEEEDEESIESRFYNDLYELEMEKGIWHEVELLGKRDDRERKRRRRREKETPPDGADGDTPGDMNTDDDDDDDDTDDAVVDEKVERMSIDEPPPATDVAADDDAIFKVTLGPAPVSAGRPLGGATGGAAVAPLNRPCARMNALLAVVRGTLYAYGGIVESGDRQLTLADLHALDLHKLDDWRTVIADEIAIENQEWEDTSSSSEDEEDDEEEEEEDEEMKAAGGGEKRDDGSMDVDSDDEHDGACATDAPPVATPGESGDDYFSRTAEFWMRRADATADGDGDGVAAAGKQLKRAARRMAHEYREQQQASAAP